VPAAPAAPRRAPAVRVSRVGGKADAPAFKAGGQGKPTRTRPTAAARAAPAAGAPVGWARDKVGDPIPRLSEGQLAAQLAGVPDVGLGQSAQRVLKALTGSMKGTLKLNGDGRAADNGALFGVRPDLASLPFRSGPGAQASGRAAVYLALLSRKLNAYVDALAPRQADGTRTSPKNLEAVLTNEKRGKRPEWLRAEAVPALQQILMHEDRPLRRLLIDLLAQIEGPAATAALVRRAVFDLDADNRAAARAALRGRRAEDYRPVLLGALRYPWAPAAWHAAEALVDLNDRQTVAHLVTFLERPDPAGVQPVKRRHVVQDLVKVLHVRNCILCHGLSATGNDVAMKVDPWLKQRTVLTKKQASALIASGQLSPASLQGYGGGGGGGGGCVTAQTDLMVRFDITFLRQDFSVPLPVGVPGTAPQRFDFVVRTRVLTPTQVARLRAGGKPQDVYPQRDAVLFALRKLTGRDAGPTTAAWQALYPDAAVEVEAGRLVRKLLKASPLALPLLLKSYGENKGEAHARALAEGVTRLPGAGRAQAREALACRLAGLDVPALQGALKDARPGVRQAAVLACAKKKDAALVGGLIARLGDDDAETARLAQSALKDVTGQDLGGAGAWRRWWEDGRAGR
jgi:HEAT repeat protein